MSRIVVTTIGSFGNLHPKIAIAYHADLIDATNLYEDTAVPCPYNSML
ncbi:hypothetical protein [Phormidesmis priestleyi]|nr:hypothetical protein [Phormidesmis priestleyi]